MRFLESIRVLATREKGSIIDIFDNGTFEVEFDSNQTTGIFTEIELEKCTKQLDPDGFLGLL